MQEAPAKEQQAAPEKSKASQKLQDFEDASKGKGKAGASSVSSGIKLDKARPALAMLTQASLYIQDCARLVNFDRHLYI